MTAKKSAPELQDFAEHLRTNEESEEAEILALREMIADNVRLTVETKERVEDTREQVASLRAKAQPVLDAMDTMKAGIRVIGRIGEAGAKIGKLVLLILACWGFIKLIFGGASWSEASSAFWRSMGR